MWQAPNITLQWGPYFKVEVEEQAKQIDMAIAAIEGGVATKRMGLELLRSVLKIESVDAALVALEEEAAEREAKANEAAHELAKMNADAGLDDGANDFRGAGSGARKDAPKPAGGGSGGAALAAKKAPKPARPA